MKGTIDHIICDPPFLSEECQTKGETSCTTQISTRDCHLTMPSKAALTVRWLSRSWGISPAASIVCSKKPRANLASRLIICTGERMDTLVNRLYRPQGIATTSFMPEHAKGLSNEFCCYANFTCSDWDWKV